MAEKIIDLGTHGPPGDTVALQGVLDNDTLGAGDTTTFHVKVTRPAADGPLATPPGLSVAALCIGGPTIDPPGPMLGVDPGSSLAAGETKSVDFQITNPPGGATPALFAIVLAVWVPASWFAPIPTPVAAGPWP